jgi:excisionase family DNA binding protein
VTPPVQRDHEHSGRLTRKALYRIPEVMALLSMSRTVVYDQIRRGRLRSVKLGRTRLIPAAAIADYVALLERETGDWQVTA